MGYLLCYRCDFWNQWMNIHNDAPHKTLPNSLIYNHITVLYFLTKSVTLEKRVWLMSKGQLVLVLSFDIIGRMKQRTFQSPVLEGQGEKNLSIYVRRKRGSLQKICKLLELSRKIYWMWKLLHGMMIFWGKKFKNLIFISSVETDGNQLLPICWFALWHTYRILVIVIVIHIHIHIYYHPWIIIHDIGQVNITMYNT
jgi:hypothetical protein